MYEFTVSGSSHPLSYGFVKQFLLSDTANTPFPANIGSPPTGIGAMLVNSAGIIAISGQDIYKYDVANGEWSLEGQEYCH